MNIAFLLLLTAVMFVSLKGARVLMTLFALELGAVAGTAPVFRTCAMLMGGGAALNRKSTVHGQRQPRETSAAEENIQ